MQKRLDPPRNSSYKNVLACSRQSDIVFSFPGSALIRRDSARKSVRVLRFVGVVWAEPSLYQRRFGPADLHGLNFNLCQGTTMAGSDVHPIHRFEPWQVWPGSYDNPAPDGFYPSPGNSGLEISRSTPIASMGSCFAREIKTVLLREGFSYITEESDHPASKHASAAWERLYNLFSMRQIFGTPLKSGRRH